MGKLIFVFLVVFAIFFVSIKVFQKLSGKEKWQLTKIATYSILCSLLTIASLTTIVVLF